MQYGAIEEIRKINPFQVNDKIKMIGQRLTSGPLNRFDGQKR